MRIFSNLFKKETIKETKKTVLEYEYILENTDTNQLKKIYKTEFSIIDIYLKPYRDNAAIKVLRLDNDNIIGDIPFDKVSEVLNFNFRVGQIYVDIYLDDGKNNYRGTVTFKRTIKT